MSNLLTISNVSYRRNGRNILQDINWSIKEGEHWAVLGRNGSGKTTFLQILNGYQWPSTGSVEMFGRRLGTFDIREVRRRVGWVSSAILPMLNHSYTPWEIIVTGKYGALAMYEEILEEDKAAAYSLLEANGLTDLAEKEFGLLSQGQKQQILICRALMADPTLLIMDEPCAGLDLRAREEFLQMVERFTARRPAPSLIFVTHHTEEIVPSVSHAMILAGGTVAAIGTKEETMNSQVLSRAFGLPLELEWHHGRPWTRLHSVLVQEG